MWLYDGIPRMSPTATVAAVGGLILAVGAADYATGYQFGCSIFYLLPVMLAAWRLGLLPGLATAAVAAGTWLLVELNWGPRYVHGLLPYWNGLVRFALYAVVTFLLVAFKSERSQVRHDWLTCLWNRRGFVERLEGEIERGARYGRPFAVALLDADRFKDVNDRHGHEAGDEVLRIVGRLLVERTRASDTAARIGGDEFAVLLPETTLDSAAEAVEKLQGALGEAMRRRGLPVTFSIGLVEFLSSPSSADEALRAADRAMYAAKRAGRNALCRDCFDRA